MFTEKTIVFIGGGMMGTAMIGGILRQGLVQPSQIIVSDPNPDRESQLVEDFGVTFTSDNVNAAEQSDYLVLAVKPQFFPRVISDLAGKLNHVEAVISIMAGVTIKTMQDGLGTSRIVRSIPNTPAAIGLGITGWTATDDLSEAVLEAAQAILSAMGETLRVPAEHYIDMVTAVSGSGPAYVFLIMEAMIDAAVHLGFSRGDAEKLVTHTLSGSVAYAQSSDTPIAVLRNQVTSPAGTTAEGLYHMEQLGLRTALARGIWGAYQRSVALGGGQPRDPDTGT